MLKTGTYQCFRDICRGTGHAASLVQTDSRINGWAVGGQDCAGLDSNHLDRNGVTFFVHPSCGVFGNIINLGKVQV